MYKFLFQLAHFMFTPQKSYFPLYFIINLNSSLKYKSRIYLIYLIRNKLINLLKLINCVLTLNNRIRPQC